VSNGRTHSAWGGDPCRARPHGVRRVRADILGGRPVGGGGRGNWAVRAGWYRPWERRGAAPAHSGPTPASRADLWWRPLAEPGSMGPAARCKSLRGIAGAASLHSSLRQTRRAGELCSVESRGKTGCVGWRSVGTSGSGRGGVLSVTSAGCGHRTHSGSRPGLSTGGPSIVPPARAGCAATRGGTRPRSRGRSCGRHAAVKPQMPNPPFPAGRDRNSEARTIPR
jgi:hypothetical protein